MTETKFDQGMAFRRAVLGDAHVDRAQAGAAELDADFQRFITETAWGSVWAREHMIDLLSRKVDHPIDWQRLKDPCHHTGIAAEKKT